MNDIEVSSIDLVEGGNVFKQGHYLTLGYVPRDEKGETVDLSGKTLNVSLWGRKGVVFEVAATYSGGVIRFTLDKMVPAGDYTVEFTVTSSTDAKYRKKFPTNQHSGRIAIKQSADDLGVVGIQVYTVAQLKAEQKAIQTQYESTVDAKVQASDAKSTTALTKSTTAETTANDVKSQFEQVVISGDSSVEAAAARVAPDQTFVSLKARLDAKEQATATQLAETAKNSGDYVKLLQSHNTTKKPLQYQIKGDRKIDVYTPLPGADKVLWRSQKDLNDDWIKTDNVDVYGMTGGGAPSTYWVDYGTVAGGTMNTAVPPNHFATTVGTTITTQLDGTEFYINAYTDARGGIWEVKVDGIVKRTFSTHVNNILPDDFLASNKTQVKVTGLSPGSHTVVLTFKGDDPAHIPSSGAGTARGWISNSAGYAIPADKENQFYSFVATGVAPVSFNKKFGVMIQLSNKEPVFRAKKAGTADALHFFPEHNSTGTAFAKEQKVLVDGVPITNWAITPSGEYIEAEIVQIVQTVDLKHPEQVSPIGTMYGITTFNSLGMTFSHEVEWHTDVLISAGYAPMIPVDINFVDSLKTSFGNIYALEKTDGTRTYLTENDRAESYLFYNRNKASEEKDYALAYNVNDVYRTFRQGEIGKHFPTTGKSMLWIEHRSGGFMNKVYPQVFDNYTATAGEKFTFGATYYVGKLFNARNLA